MESSWYILLQLNLEQALAICTVSDHIRTNEQTTAEERQRLLSMT